MNKKRSAFLVDGYIKGNLKPEEHLELMGSLSNPENEELRLQFLDHCYNQIKGSCHFSDDVSEEIIEKIFAATRQVTQTPAKKQFRRENLRKLAAVGVLVLGFSMLFYFSLRKNAPDLYSEKSQFQIIQEIAPGGNVATLILSDGSRISLDDLQEGLIDRQGNVQILKTSSGQISYYQESTEEQQIAEISFNTVVTPRGGQYQIKLPDGSQVWLNAESKIRFPLAFSNNERRVEVSGEAYFDIVPNPEKPFLAIVKTGDNSDRVDMIIKVNGTQFNVMAYANEDIHHTTLVEGEISISKPHDSAPGRKLVAGEQARIHMNGEIEVIIADVNEAIAWKNGYFLFNDEEIEGIMRKLARWYDFDVDYKGTLTYRNFSAHISRFEDFSRVLQKFELTGAVHFAIEEKKITVMPSKKNSK